MGAVSALAALALEGPLAYGRATPEQKCVARKLRAAAAKTAAKLGCQAQATLSGSTPDPLCLARAESKFLKAFRKAEAKGGCPTTGDAPRVEAAVDACVASLLPGAASTTTTTPVTTTSTTLVACAPVDVSGFTPPAYKPATGGAQVQCTPAQITQFYTGCLAPESTGVTCAPFGGSGPAANQACAACIVTSGNASAYGPLIQDSGALSINVAGCLEIKGDLGCAQAVQAVEMCLLAACEANCPVTDNASLAVLKACKQQATSGGCASFATPADTCRAAQTGGPGAECLQGATFEEQYNVVVPVFCGAAAS